MALIDQNAAESNTVSMYSGVRTGVAQSFTGTGVPVKYLVVRVNKNGAPTGSAYAKIYAHTGTYGSSSKPTGAALATSEAADVTTLPSGTNDFRDLLLTFATPFTPTNGTYYCIAFEYAGGDASNNLRVRVDDLNQHGGNYSYFDGSLWQLTGGRDLHFRMYDPDGQVATTLYLSDHYLSAQLEALDIGAAATLDEAQGWTVDKKGATNYSVYYPDTTRASTTFDTTEPSSFSQYGYRSLMPLTGVFANAGWVLDFKVKSNAYYAQKGYVGFRLWRSANADGSGATQVTPGWQYSSEIAFTAANEYRTGTVTWSPGAAKILTGEYLFLEIVWKTSLSGGNNAAAVYWVHNEGTAQKLVTPTFTSVNTGTVAGVLAPLLGSGSGNVKIAGTGAATLAPLTSSESGGVKVTGAGVGQAAALIAALTGGVNLGGSLAADLAALTAALEGLVLEGGLNGGLAAQLAPLAAGAAGQIKIGGEVSAPLSPVLGDASGEVRLAGSLAPQLAALQADLHGDLGVAGALLANHLALNALLDGNVKVGGLVEALLAQIIAELWQEGFPLIAGEIAANLLPVAVALAGNISIGGGFSCELAPLTGAEIGEIGIVALLAALLAPMPACLAGEVPVAAELAGGLSQLGSLLSGSIQIGGQLAAAVGQVIAQLMEAPPDQIIGLLAASLPPLTGNWAGQIKIAGTAVPLLAALTAAAAGDTDIGGELTAALAPLLAALPAALQLEGNLQANIAPLMALLRSHWRTNRGLYLALALDDVELTLNLD
jgi:hypothetical protein